MTSRDMVLIALVALGSLVLLPMGMMWFGGWGMMGPGMMGRPGYGLGALFSLTLAVIVAAMTLVVLAFMRKQQKAEDPADLLKRRLASGEITRAQFDDLKQALQ